MCCISGSGKQGYHSDSFSISELSWTTNWLCQVDAVCSTASCQICRRGMCALLVYTSIIHMIFERHTEEALAGGTV